MHNLSTDGAYCGISRGTTLDWSEFDPDELAANIAMRERADPDVPLHPNQCGPCWDCQEAMTDWGVRLQDAHRRRRARAKSRQLTVFETETTQARAPKGRPVAKRQRRTSVELRAQVLGLRDRGLVPTAIADALNISDRRCREILSRLGNPENGGHNPSVQAAQDAANAVGGVMGRPGQLVLVR